MSRTIAHSTPYAWPFDGRLEPSRVCLLVLSSSTGSVEDSNAQVAWSRVNELVQGVEAAGGVVLRVGTTPPNGSHRVGGREITPEAALDVCDVQSFGVDGFYASALDTMLRARGVDQLLICGQWLETCVHSTMRSANDRGFECLLVLDACAPYDVSLVPAARSQIEMSGGIFGAVGLTEDVLAALAALPESERTAS